MKVREIMTSDVISVDAAADMEKAFLTMADSRCRHLPVLRGGKVVGMLSDRDFRQLGMKVETREMSGSRAQAVLRVPAESYMSEVVRTIEPDMPVSDAVNLFTQSPPVGALPVVDKSSGKMTGILSYVDCLKLLSRMLAEGAS